MEEIKSWDEFRETGLFLFMNMFLHIFGWAIVLELDIATKQITKAYPARVTCKGFTDVSIQNAYEKLGKCIKDCGC